MPDKPNPKQKIINSAINLYVSGDKKYTVKNIASGAKLKESDVYNEFNAKSHILPAYYPSTVQRFREMIAEIDDFESFSLEEKLSTFIYSMFDILQEQREFVDETFDEMVFRRAKNSPFQQEVATVFRDFLETSPAASAMQGMFVLRQDTYDFLAKEYTHLLKFWLRDTTENFSSTVALTDKLVSFLAELVQSGLIDKGVDLFKFFVNNGILKFDLPLISRIVSMFTGGRS